VKTLSPLFLIIPLSGIISFWLKIRFANKLMRNGVQVQGVIVSQKNGGRNTFTKVRFQTSTGTVIEAERISIIGEVEHFDGAEAHLLYDIENPANFLFLEELNQSKNYLALGIFIVLLLVFTLILIGQFT